MFVLILEFALLPRHLSDGTQKGQQVKLTIHLCETDNWISFFPNKRCKNVCRTVSVVTVNIPERDRSLFWLLSGTAVTTPVGCRFVANQSMFTWKWISKVERRGMHTTPVGCRGGGERNPAIEMPFKAKGVVQKILHRGLGANSGVNGQRTSSNTHILILRSIRWGLPRSALLFGLYPRPTAIRFCCHAKKSTAQSCIPQTRCQSTSSKPSVLEDLNARNQTSLHFA